MNITPPAPDGPIGNEYAGGTPGGGPVVGSTLSGGVAPRAGVPGPSCSGVPDPSSGGDPGPGNSGAAPGAAGRVAGAPGASILGPPAARQAAPASMVRTTRRPAGPMLW